MERYNLRAALVSLIRGYLKSANLDNQTLPEVYLEFSSQKEYGDLSLNLALKLSKILNKPPREIADSIAAYAKEKIKGTLLEGYIASVQVAGPGFVNFSLDKKYFQYILKEIIRSGDNFGRNQSGRGKKLLIEFVSANPTGPLSVAHARQAAVGDALSKILKFSGFSVKREYYLNDEGNQINLLGKSIEARFKELKGQPSIIPEGGYEGEYICQIAREILNKKQGAGSKGQEFFSEYGVKYILRVIRQELKDFGVEFDSWYSQRKLTNSGRIKKVLALFRKRGFLYEKDKATWFKSSALGDDKDRVLIKSDGSYTYITPDIAYHQVKYQRGFNVLINLWGPDHHGYIARIKAAIQALGNPADSLSIIIVQLATIFKGREPLPMSTRKGRYITLRAVLDEVGPDASRFFFLMRRTSAHLDFDLELAKKQSPENPVYYVQYAHARICSIMRSAGCKPSVNIAGLSLLNQPEEIRLIKMLWKFPRALEMCYKNIDPYFVTVYLQEVAEALHSFYDRHRVLGDDKKLTQARLALISAVRIVLHQGLKLLGISAPESM
ncbi:arginine--tRNA ligase [Candidatus Omnitrophota bacterium]